MYTYVCLGHFFSESEARPLQSRPGAAGGAASEAALPRGDGRAPLLSSSMLGFVSQGLLFWPFEGISKSV